MGRKARRLDYCALTQLINLSRKPSNCSKLVAAGLASFGVENTMRLSSLIFALLLLISSAFIAVAQHASGGGTAASHGSVSGNFGSSARAFASSTAASNMASQPHVANNTGTRAPSSATEQGKNHGWSLLHPSRKEPAPPLLNTHIRSLCLKGSCQVCRPGQARRGGSCVGIPNACQLTWNSYGCGTQAWFYQDCSLLENQLETEGRWLPGQAGVGRGLRYRALMEQYERCAETHGPNPFRAYAFNDVPFFQQAP